MESFRIGPSYQCYFRMHVIHSVVAALARAHQVSLVSLASRQVHFCPTRAKSLGLGSIDREPLYTSLLLKYIVSRSVDQPSSLIDAVIETRRVWYSERAAPDFVFSFGSTKCPNKIRSSYCKTCLRSTSVGVLNKAMNKAEIRLKMKILTHCCL